MLSHLMLNENLEERGVQSYTKDFLKEAKHAKLKGLKLHKSHCAFSGFIVFTCR